MRKYIKNAVSLLIAAAMLQPIVPNAKENNTENPAFEKAQSFMTELSILKASGKNEVSTVTRAEFASYILSAMGLAEDTGIDDETKQSYLGYTENSEYDENGDWIWKSEEEREEEGIRETETPFCDVSSTHQYWNSIRLAAQLGIMRGDGERCFRPDEAITGYEMIKVFTEACGAGVFAQGNYPTGYLAQAKALGVTDGISSAIGDYPAQYATVVIGLRNALEAEIYVPETYGSDGSVDLVQKDGYTLLEYWRNIKFLNGTVERTRNSGIGDAKGLGSEQLEIGGRIFDCEGVRSDTLLGMRVKLYYTESDGTSNVGYIEKSDKNRELVIGSDDIIGYSNPYLSYTVTGTERSKQLYLGADTRIIYNGKYISDYSDDIFDFDGAMGSVRFLDADGDGKYETAFVTQSELFWIDLIDYNKKIVYDKLTTALSTLPDSVKRKENSVNLNDGTVEVFDTEGNELSVDNLLPDMTVYVQRTLPSQGESVTTLICSAQVFTGMVEKKKNDSVTINGEEYGVLDIVDMSVLNPGMTAEFYLTPDGEIAVFKNQGGLELGYLVSMASDENSLSPSVHARLYSISGDSLRIYTLPDKVTYNKSKIKAQLAAKKPEIYDSAERKTIPQPIKFKTNTDGELCEILTANYDVHEFYTERLAEPWLGYRNYGMLYSGKPMYYASAATRYINVPKGGGSDENSYYRETLRHNEFQQINVVCKDDVDSNYASLLIKESDLTNTNAVSSSASVYMVTDIGQTTDNDGGSVWQMTARTTSLTTTASVYKSELQSVCEDLEPGDLVKMDLGGSPWQVMKMEKVFDVGEKCLATTKNPSDSSIVAQSFYIHGSATRRTDNGDIIDVTPYIYTVSGGKIQKTLAESNPTNNYPFYAKRFGLLIFYTDRGIVESGSYSADILPQDSTGTENDIIVCTQWGDPVGMFMYK